MKFVIKSLLFVNLLLQMTNSLRKCFNQDQNLMLTIILLAFSLIGIIGLTVGNRFILIIFAACMTLILIASITIYAIGKTEPDASKPKVPYFTNVLHHQQSDLGSATEQMRGNRMKSFVNKLFNRGQHTQTTNSSKQTGAANKRTRNKPTRPPSSLIGQQNSSASRTNQKRLQPAQSLLHLPQAVEDYSDESTGVVHLLLSSQAAAELPFARTGLVADNDNSLDERPEPPPPKAVESGSRKHQETSAAAEVDMDGLTTDDGSNMVPSQQWIVYERHLYERYLDMVSQSIDLIMLTILASWMALLLDEDSDQCFGTTRGSKSHSSGGGHTSGGGGGKHSEVPIYNYNGVRYSIKPDEAADSLPSRVVVH